jgi:hypothetical protein
MTQPRTPRRKSSFSVKDLQDYDGETPELEIVSEAQEQKRRKLLDDIDGGKLKSTNELHSSKTVRHKDSGDRDAGYSEKHEEGNLAKRNHQLQTAISDKQQSCDNVYHRGLDSPSSSHKQQLGFRTRSNTQDNFYGRMSTCSTVKNTRPSETVTEINPPRSRTLSLRRLSSRISGSSMKEVGASHGNSVKQSRADEIGMCSKCNQSRPNLSRVPGCSVFVCSACRRKSRAVDPDVSVITDFQVGWIVLKRPH